MITALAKMPRILYFIPGVSPSLDDQLAAEKLAPMRVSFRNASMVGETGALEICDGWAGDATPKRYRKAYGTAAQAAKKYKEAREALYAKTKADDEQAQKETLDANVKDTEADAKKKADAKAVTDAAAKEAEEKADEAKKKAEGWKPNA